MKIENKISYSIITATILLMAFYFVVGDMQMNDDGFHYEGFAESLAQGKLDFKSFYGFQGLSFFAVPIFWLTGSHNSIIIASAIFSLLSIPLAYFIGKEFYGDRRAGIYFLILFLLTPYPYTTMMRGFQEAAVLFFVLLVIYASIRKKLWPPIAWAVGGVVKPFVLVLFPLFIKDFLNSRKIVWLILGLFVGGLYLSASYYQTGHLVNNAAINSYQGNFDLGNPPPLGESFVLGLKGYLRVGANLLLHFRKIMLSPLVILLGAFSLLLNKNLKLRKEMMLAIILNFFLVGSLSFSFSKYLLAMTTLFALASVSYLLKRRWLMWLVLIDSFFVFLPIWNYFGHNYWDNILIYLIPLWLTVVVLVFDRKFKIESIK
ncbi:MAG: hypothetical protein HYT64_01485 [Candidatus Yanofskybacteria bacterium]|nr:hypothetical protein [Candidatus Yanofskybacteria bacterium]